MTDGIPDVALIVTVGTALLLLLGMFIAFMTLTYQKKRLQHQEEVTGLVEAYQKEILKARIEMQEQTLLSISQEIHDNVGQILSLVRLNVSMIKLTGDAAAEHKIQACKGLLDQAIEDLRNLSKRLNSKYVSQQSLSSLLRLQLELIQKTGALEASIMVTGEQREKALDPEKKLIVFRIAQEALSNVIRHAEASSITVQLLYTDEAMTLSITDDGKGFKAPNQPSNKVLPQGTGTHNMYYRAGLIGATLRVQTRLGIGTVIYLKLPLI